MSEPARNVYVPRAKREAMAREAEAQQSPTAEEESSLAPHLISISDEETKDWSFARKWFFDRSETFKRLQNVKKQFGEDPRVENLFNQQRANSTQNAPVSRRFADQFYQCMQDIDDTADSVLTRNATRPIDNYLDLGCSPGGFSSWVMDQYPDAMGLGVTLPPDIGGLPMVSFPEGDYEVNYADLTDLRQTTEAIEKRFGSDADGVVDLALAAAIYRDVETAQPRSRNKDDEPSAPPGARVILSLSQISLVLKHLQAGGHFVFVLSNKPDPITIQTLVLLRKLFKRIFPCKGKTLHGVRSSFYLFCEAFDRENYQTEQISALLDKTIESMRETAQMIIQEGDNDSAELEQALGRLGISDNKNKEFFAADMIWLPGYPDQNDLLEKEGDFVQEFFQKLWLGQVRSIEEKISNLDRQNPSRRGGRPGWVSKGSSSFGEHSRGHTNTDGDQPAVRGANTWRRTDNSQTPAPQRQSQTEEAEDGWQIAKGKAGNQAKATGNGADGGYRTIAGQKKDPSTRGSSAFSQDQGAFGGSWRR